MQTVGLATEGHPHVPPGPRTIIPHAEALGGESPRDRLMAHALNWMTRVLPATYALFYPVDQRLNKWLSGEIVAKAPGRRLEALDAMMDDYSSGGHHALDPFGPRRFAETAVTIVDIAAVGGRRMFDSSSHATRFLGPFGLTDQVTVLLRARGRIVAGVDLLVGEDDPPVHAQQCALLRYGQPFLEHAYACMDDVAGVHTRAAPVGPEGDLTPREADVARLVAEGATNAEIARALCMSPATVKTHLYHAYAKLNVRSRTQLAVLFGQETDEAGRFSRKPR